MREGRLIDELGWQKVLDTIGAKRAEIVTLDSVTKKIYEQFTNGSGIGWSDVRKLRKTWRSESPFIDVEGRPFVLFIYDQAGVNYRSSTYGISQYGHREYKYHFCWCSTLEKMSAGGRRGRYKSKYDIDNNVFTVFRGGNSDDQIEMNVCKNCLHQMDYAGYNTATYSERDSIYKEFDIAYFFSLKLPTDLLKPTHPFHTGRYPADWHIISRNLIKKRGSKCEECNSTQHLQVHHINGVKDDINENNLKVLCYRHHSQQEFHRHMMGG